MPTANRAWLGVDSIAGTARRRWLDGRRILRGWRRCRTEWSPPSEAAAKERIAKWCANETGDLGFAIETIDDPLILVGNLGLFGARLKDRCATVGTALGREHIGRGYGTDAMQVIVDYGFREMGLHRIQLSVAPFNPAASRAHQKAGFVEEGRRRDAVWHAGRWYDEAMVSVLVYEWAAQRPPEITWSVRSTTHASRPNCKLNPI